FRLALARRPDATERKTCLQFLARQCEIGQGFLGRLWAREVHLLHGQGLLAAPASSGVGRGKGLQPRPGHFPGPVRSVIQLVQEGGPSQTNLFDPKPELRKRDGQKPPANTVENFQPGSESQQLRASPFKFRRHGRCGMEMSEHLPHLGTVADDLCLVRSMFSENNNHPEAQQLMLTGKIAPGRPTLGAWASY